MLIGLIARRFDPAGGGTERDLIITARILADAGYEVRIYAAEIRNDAAGLDVRQLHCSGFGRSARLRSFARRAADEARRDGVSIVLSFARIADADLLRSGGSAHSSYIAAARQWQNAATATVMALSPYHRAQVALERRGFASSTLRCAIAVSDLVRNDLIRTFRLDPAKAVTLYNGVDLERFQPSSRDRWRDSVRRELGLSETVPIVVFAGNGFARKGLRFLIEAWPQVDSKALLVVAGQDRTTAKYRRLARRLGMEERVRFIGPQARIEQLFAAADVFALPSLFEPFGNVIMEAMATGLPVLCSSACGASELLTPAMREFIVADPTAVGELASRMNAIVKARDDLRPISRATAEHYTWATYGTNLLKIIRAL